MNGLAAIIEIDAARAQLGGRRRVDDDGQRPNRRVVGQVASVAELLGHRSLKMIATHYAHMEQRSEHLKKATLCAVGDGA